MTTERGAAAGAIAFGLGGLLLLVAGVVLSRRLSMLSQLHPLARKVFHDFIDEVEALTGWKVEITSGFRSFAKQKGLVESGNPHAVAPGYSPHNYGLAIDINLVRGGERIGMNSSRAEWIATGVVAIAKKYKIRWGGDFAQPDRVHFDLGWSRAIARRLLEQERKAIVPV